MPLAPLKPLRRWIWRAFLQSALIPLVLVESVLIGVYLYTNESIRESQVGYLQSSALQDLDSAVRREGKVIDSRLRAIEAQVGVYRDAVAEALADRRFEPDELERQRHASTPGGVFHSRSDDGRAASFYAASTPAERQDRDKALRLSRVDPLMRSIKQADPLVAAVYFNSWDSYNRIYPYFDVLQQYPHDMDIPQYNFYYLADATHNPKRGTVWTEVYLDPAGLGWMMSAIAPVYRGDFLEGVVGLDVTVGQMLAETGNLQVPWQGYALLVGPDNAIMALPAAGEKDFGLRELTSYSYAEAVSREVLKPEDFKLDRQPGLRPLLDGMAAKPHGVVEVQLGGARAADGLERGAADWLAPAAGGGRGGYLPRDQSPGRTVPDHRLPADRRPGVLLSIVRHLDVAAFAAPERRAGRAHHRHRRHDASPGLRRTQAAGARDGHSRAGGDGRRSAACR